MLVCFYGCAIWTAYLSVTRSALLPNYQFVGLVQYVGLFGTPRWNVAWSNMFLFGVLDILGTLGLGVLLAVLLDRQVRLEGAFRTILLSPLSISFIVTGLTWRWIYPPTIGFQNFVRGAGLERLRVRLDHPTRAAQSIPWCLPEYGTKPA